MPSRTTIWFRDAFVIIFAIYVVVSIAMVPWSNLKITEPASTSCPTGCSPSINFPEDNYHHYDDSLIFNWNAVAVTYRTEIVDSEGQIVFETNLTEFNSTTSSRLKIGNYTSSVYYTGIAGSNFSELIKTDDHQLDSSSKITLQWDKIGVTYTIQIRKFDDENRDVPIIHQASNVTETLYEYSSFVEGEEYVWTVFAVDDLGFSSESSSDRDLRIGTTKF